MPQFWQNPDGSEQYLCRGQQGASSSLERSSRTTSRPTRPLAVTPPGAISLGHPLVQPARPESRSATRSPPIEKAEQRDQSSGEHPRQFSGHRAGVPASLGQRAAADRRRADRRLHRPRRALREHDPSDHDSFHASVRRRRRAAGAAGLSTELIDHRADRHHFADRHREKERHHDDRFRARRRAQRRK